MESSAKVVEALKAAAVTQDGRLTLRCVDAFAVADRLHTDLATIGRLCNENRIKIVQCQLGCFR